MISALFAMLIGALGGALHYLLPDPEEDTSKLTPLLRREFAKRLIVGAIAGFIVGTYQLLAIMRAGIDNPLFISVIVSTIASGYWGLDILKIAIQTRRKRV